MGKRTGIVACDYAVEDLDTRLAEFQQELMSLDRKTVGDDKEY